MPFGTTSIEIPKGAHIVHEAFKSRTSLTLVIISQGVRVDNYAFMDCTGLQKVVISEGVKVGYYAFQFCTQLVDVVLTKDVSIGDSAFKRTGLRKLVIHEGTNVDYRAFGQCTALKEVIIHEGVAISSWVFLGCKGLTDLIIPKGARIDSESFFGCTRLKRVVIHQGAEVHRNAFAYCSRLIFIVIPDDFSGVDFPSHALIVTQTQIEEFYSDKNGLRDLELEDKIKIYQLCYRRSDFNRADFAQLSHLSVSTMLDVIQLCHLITGNAQQSKQLLAWTMVTGFARSNESRMLTWFKRMTGASSSDTDVLDEIAKARSHGPTVTAQEFLSVEEWRIIKCLSKSHSLFSPNIGSSRAVMGSGALEQGSGVSSMT
tara:strand:+ start:326 stop:1441 length:1116 start_codon:yes stop_codon:yes gene_type:complete